MNKQMVFGYEEKDTNISFEELDDTEILAESIAIEENIIAMEDSEHKLRDAEYILTLAEESLAIDEQMLADGKVTLAYAIISTEKCAALYDFAGLPKEGFSLESADDSAFDPVKAVEKNITDKKELIVALEGAMLDSIRSSLSNLNAGLSLKHKAIKQALNKAKKANESKYDKVIIEPSSGVKRSISALCALTGNDFDFKKDADTVIRMYDGRTKYLDNWLTFIKTNFTSEKPHDFKKEYYKSVNLENLSKYSFDKKTIPKNSGYDVLISYSNYISIIYSKEVKKGYNLDFEELTLDVDKVKPGIQDTELSVIIEKLTDMEKITSEFYGLASKIVGYIEASLSIAPGVQLPLNVMSSLSLRFRLARNVFGLYRRSMSHNILMLSYVANAIVDAKLKSKK